MRLLETWWVTQGFVSSVGEVPVEHWVTMRDKGLLPDGTTPVERSKLIDGFMPKRNGLNDRTAGSAAMSCSTSSSRSGSLGRTAPRPRA